MQKNEITSTVMPLFEKEGQRVRANAPVAVLDSGVGGIGVLREIRKCMPCEELLYFGDSAAAPYAVRTKQEVRALVMAHAARLLEQAKALVLACNTATALCVDALRRRYPGVPIIGMEPAIKPALSVGTHPRVLVLATATTLREPRFAALLARYQARGEVIPVAACEMVRLVEEGKQDSPEMRAYLQALLAPYLAEGRPDAVVLGCTHFPFAKHALSAVLGEEVPQFDGAAGTAAQLRRRLQAAGLCNPRPTRGAVRFTSSKPGVLPLYIRFLHDGE